MLYIANAFSLGMIDASLAQYIAVTEISLDDAKKLVSSNKFVSSVGHESTAKLLSRILGVKIEAKRTMIKLTENDKLLVFQLLERLPEGKVLSDEEIEQLFREGRAKFLLVAIVTKQIAEMYKTISDILKKYLEIAIKSMKEKSG